MTILESLRALNNYPIPTAAIMAVAGGRGIDVTEDVDEATFGNREYRLACADLLTWLSMAPNVSQGGQSYSFSENERKTLRLRANAMYGELGEDTNASGNTKYGYKGEWL